MQVKRLGPLVAYILVMGSLNLAACGTAGPGAASGGEVIHVWALTDPQNEPVIQAGIEEFNATSGVKAELTTYVNDTYKQKLQVSMGSPNAPDVFLNWGGGNLAQFVEAGQVVDLTGALSLDTTAANAFLPNVASFGVVNGRQYALPMNGIQPVILFYNKEVFADAGLQPPKTYADLIRQIAAFKERGIIPIALAGAQGWTELMYLEYLLDRFGGPQKFQDIAAKKAGAWRDPAVLTTLRTIQDLVKRGAFGSSYSSVNYDNTGASKLFSTGKAAMHLMGSWEYASLLSKSPEFVNSGAMGWTTFPTVTNGLGDPKSIVGNPSNFFSISSSSKHIEAATDFVVTTMTSSRYVNELISTGQVPAVRGVQDRLAGTANGDFTTFTYQLVSDAPSFTQSWDQALTPALGSEILTNLQKLFLLTITPEQFVAAIEKAKR